MSSLTTGLTSFSNVPFSDTNILTNNCIILRQCRSRDIFCNLMRYLFKKVGGSLCECWRVCFFDYYIAALGEAGSQGVGRCMNFLQAGQQDKAAEWHDPTGEAFYKEVVVAKAPGKV